jgi:RND family efflux transporter MFP subunit
VTHHLVNVGALVGVSGPTQLATIVQTNPLFVYFNVSESQVLQIKRLLVGEGRTVEQLDLSTIPIEIGLAGENGYSHTGHLDYIAPQVDASTGTLLVRGIVENESQLLLPGLFVRVRVPTRKLSAATLVQDDAIGTDQRGNYVLVVGDDDVVVQKYVKTGPRQGNLRIIDAGLGPNDWVVSAGVELAVPGNKVAPERTVLAPSLVGAGSSPSLKAQ